MPRLHLQNCVGDAIEKITIMRDHQHRFIRFDQPLFQPQNHLLVKMIGRLVQDQQVAGTDQGAGQRDAAALTAGTRSHLLTHVVHF